MKFNKNWVAYVVMFTGLIYFISGFFDLQQTKLGYSSVSWNFSLIYFGIGYLILRS